MNDNHENRVNSNTRLINSTIKLAALLSLHVLEHVFDFIYSVSKKKKKIIQDSHEAHHIEENNFSVSIDPLIRY